MNNEFAKDISRGLAFNNIGELAPGTTGRRYEPSGGTTKHNDRIHRESKYADSSKNLPFSFRKPPKSSGRLAYVSCNNCGYITQATTNTVGMICKECGKFSSVQEVFDV